MAALTCSPRGRSTEWLVCSLGVVPAPDPSTARPPHLSWGGTLCNLDTRAPESQPCAGRHVGRWDGDVCDTADQLQSGPCSPCLRGEARCGPRPCIWDTMHTTARARLPDRGLVLNVDVTSQVDREAVTSLLPDIQRFETKPWAKTPGVGPWRVRSVHPKCLRLGGFGGTFRTSTPRRP